jgi:hypothetical protein
MLGVVSGVVADDHGNIYVADRLQSVVLIFDGNFPDMEPEYSRCFLAYMF